MQKNMIGFLLLALLGSSSVTYSQNVKIQMNEKNYIKFITLDKGIIRTILIPKDDSFKTKTTPYSVKQINAKQGIIIRFKSPSPEYIDEFKTKYGLKFHTKLFIDYYIFQNLSKQSDIQLINNIIENETNIETIKPNWHMKNIPR